MHFARRVAPATGDTHAHGRRRNAALAFLTAVGLVAGLAAVLPASASAAGSFTASFAPAGDWGSGHQATITVTNASTTSAGSWTLEFDLPAGTAITSSWDADVVKTGNHYKVTSKSWAGPFAPGASQSWGWVGSGPFKQPTGCTVNGAACTGGTPTTPPTSPPTTPTPTPTTTPTPTATPTPTPTPTVSPTTPPVGGKKLVGYFAEWGVYGRNYQVNNIRTSGSASKLTHILYAFGNTTGGKCSIGDSYADYDKAYTADQSVDGVADTWDQPLRGNFNQLKKLKAANPGLKIIWSFGGWTWSSGFTQAAANPTAFAQSCYDLINDPRWAGLWDGIDIDWEYPNACGLQCDTSGPNAFNNVITALRNKFGASFLVTAAVTADGSNGGKIDATDYASAVGKLSWLMPMTYDYFGAWNPQGPTAPNAPLTSYPGIPQAGFNAEDAINKFIAKGVPASKILLGVGFYGRGWTGVTQSAPGGSATGPAPGTYEQGIEDYKVLTSSCPATGTVGGTAYAKCGNQWWSYDTPATMTSKMTWAKNKGLGGAFFWELSGDTANGELISAMKSGLS